VEADFLYIDLDSVRFLLLRSYGRAGPLGSSATTAGNVALVVHCAFPSGLPDRSSQVSRLTE
jgi:hypothetical protein